MRITLTCSLETYKTGESNREWHYQVVHHPKNGPSYVCGNSPGTKRGGYKTEKQAVRAGKTAIKRLLIDNLETIGAM
jgi:hypothetical protein